jgi:prepilin signal peptidase PulO-like enzyme (type II secretory pathway)
MHSLSLFGLSPALLTFILLFTWTALTGWTWRRFAAFERHFFSSADVECRAFVAESYIPNPPDLGTFKWPTFGGLLPLAVVTFLFGVGVVVSYSLFPGIDLIRGTLLVMMFFFAQRLTWFDAKHLFLPDEDVVGLGFFTLCFAALIHPVEFWPEVVWSVIGLGAFLWVLTTAFRVLRGKEGLGFGDVKLLFAITPLLGLSVLTHVLLLASMLGVVWWVGRRLVKRPTESQFPFGPFLLLGWGIALIHFRHPFLPW